MTGHRQSKPPTEAQFFDHIAMLRKAIQKLLPPAEAEQENLYGMAKNQPDDYQTAYEDCRHAVSFAYEAVDGPGAQRFTKPRKAKRPPPDPEGMNGDRAEWAGAALRHFQCVTGTDYEESLGDLLGDLMHWSDRNNFDFEAALFRARGHYAAETTASEKGEAS